MTKMTTETVRSVDGNSPNVKPTMVGKRVKALIGLRFISLVVAIVLLSFLAGIPFTIGASAAICGLIGAILYYGKSRGGFYGEAIYRQAMGWVVGLVLFGLFLPGINNWAHGGGIVSGLLIAFLTGYNERRAETWIYRILGTGSILMTAAALLWAVIQAVVHLTVS